MSWFHGFALELPQCDVDLLVVLNDLFVLFENFILSEAVVELIHLILCAVKHLFDLFEYIGTEGSVVDNLNGRGPHFVELLPHCLES